MAALVFFLTVTQVMTHHRDAALSVHRRVQTEGYHGDVGPKGSQDFELEQSSTLNSGILSSEGWISWVSLVSQNFIYQWSRDDRPAVSSGVLISLTCITKNRSLESFRGCQEKVSHTSMDFHPAPFLFECATSVWKRHCLTTGPSPDATHNTMEAVFSSTSHVPMAPDLPGCHMFRILLLPDVCQSFPF